MWVHPPFWSTSLKECSKLAVLHAQSGSCQIVQRTLTDKDVSPHKYHHEFATSLLQTSFVVETLLRQFQPNIKMAQSCFVQTCDQVITGMTHYSKWYFVTKIVLTNCEKKLFLLIEKNFWNLRPKAENLQNFWEKL